MKCPFCGATDDKVVDSRESREGEAIRRRRECVSCGRRFTSYETIEEIPYMVVKNDGRREAFDRKKLRAGLVKACEKRPVAPARLDAIVDEIETLLHDAEEREIATSRVGSLVMERLRELDKVAYVRFASVYRKFEDVDEFLLELKNLIGRAETKVTS
jgi:transcriptional repressor NrdR